MPAPKGNNYPEKWTEKKALKFFKDSLKTLEEDDSIYFIGTLAKEMGWYKSVYAYLHNKFKNVNEVFVTIKKQMDTILESRVVDKGYERSGAAMSIFVLKNNHEWKDKSEVEHINQEESDESIESRISKLLGKAGIAGTTSGEGEEEDD